MRHTLIRLVVLLSVLAAAPLTADLVVCDMARVKTQSSHPDDCLGAVVIDRIDGEKRVLSSQGFLLEPGVHTINGRVTLDTTKCPTADGYKQLSHTPALAVNFEAGKTYYIAYDHSSDKSHEWTLVVWKMEQTCSPFRSCLPATPVDIKKVRPRSGREGGLGHAWRDCLGIARHVEESIYGGHKCPPYGWSVG